MAKASQPDRVPSRSLRPRTSMDRMANGDHLGQCPTCGGLTWWDNRARKSTGEMAPTQPDYGCVDCRHGRWDDGREQPGRRADRRRPAVVVTVLPTATRPVAGDTTGQRCAALKRDGTPCQNGAMSGSPFCGPHTSGTGGEPTNQCQGTTKAGKPCRAGAMRGQRYCPQHSPQDAT